MEEINIQNTYGQKIHIFQPFALYGRYYITKRTRQIAANLAIYAAFLVVKTLVLVISYLLLSFQVILY